MGREYSTGLQGWAKECSLGCVNPPPDSLWKRDASSRNLGPAFLPNYAQGMRRIGWGKWHCGGGAADRMDGDGRTEEDREDNGMPSEEGRNVGLALPHNLHTCKG